MSNAIIDKYEFYSRLIPSMMVLNFRVCESGIGNPDFSILDPFPQSLDADPSGMLFLATFL
jgi:hypothetical protein